MEKDAFEGGGDHTAGPSLSTPADRKGARLQTR